MPDPRRISKVEWLQLYPRAESMFVHVDAACLEYGIHTAQRITAALAQWSHETGDFLRLEESFNYSPERLLKVFPRYFKTFGQSKEYSGHPERIANLVYGGRMGNGPEASGDGWRYRGRGIPMLTGLNNYRAAEKGLGVALVEFPDQARGPMTASRLGGWYWQSGGFNELADHDQFDAICDKINLGRITAKVGDSNGYQDRFERWIAARKVLGLAVTGLA